MAAKTTLPVLETKHVAVDYDDLAPDGSEIRLLARVSRGNMAHCTLPTGWTSKTTRHKTIEELWYFISGEGRMWRKLGDQEEIVDVKPGVSINIPAGTSFQFQNTGSEPLCMVIVAMPPWPGNEESIPQPEFWEVKLNP